MSTATFINQILDMLYGKMPSYCYYTDGDDFSNFFNNLTDEDYENIYDFLVVNRKISESIKNKKEGVNNYIKNLYF